MTDRLELIALRGIPLVEPGDDLVEHIHTAIRDADITLVDGDCLVIAQKVVSKAEDRYSYLSNVVPSEEAFELATRVDKDPRLVEIILSESVNLLRLRPGLMIVEHRLGYVHANAGIDQSNISNVPSNPRVLLLPLEPDKSAAQIRTGIKTLTDADVSIIINDSAGRAWRNGIVGFTVGSAGILPIVSQVGKKDLFGNTLESTEIAIADELAAAASILMGQSAEGIPVVLIRGGAFERSEHGSTQLIRDKQADLFR